MSDNDKTDLEQVVDLNAAKEPTPEQQLQMMKGELDDAHLIIGRQQVALARQTQMLQNMQEQLIEKTKQLEARTEILKP